MTPERAKQLAGWLNRNASREAVSAILMEAHGIVLNDLGPDAQVEVDRAVSVRSMNYYPVGRVLSAADHECDDKCTDLADVAEELDE